MSIPSLAFNNMLHLDLEFENDSEDILLSLLPKPVSFDFNLATAEDIDRLYELITYDPLFVPFDDPTISRHAKKRNSARVEVFEDMELGEAPDFFPLPEVEMTFAQEYSSFFNQPK